MSDKIISRTEGTVALPEAGEGAYLQFTVRSFEILETAFPDKDDHISFIMKSMVNMKASVFAKVVGATLQNSTNGDIPYGLKWEELTDRIMDALCLSIHGRTGEEQKAFEQEQINKQIIDRLKGIEANPQLAALLSSMSPGQQEQGQG
ncbi:hypothetical protein [Rhizobium azibense]|uniref:Uncharacterized protein n=1 Tax=Rhizobium azibense TaxID=1136135 RepID=A0A4R3RF37_9HYPH|nr:hypothetical protein [Rhizobium azibense]TCU34168.1 hypothetical protein EV129_113153 [Rhizobium azibense]